MTKTLLLFCLALACGLLVGWIFFYGLHRTVQALPSARRPALLLGASLLARMALLLLGCWLLILAGAGWQQLLAALFGILAMRLLVLRRYGGLALRERGADNTAGSREQAR